METRSKAAGPAIIWDTEMSYDGWTTTVEDRENHSTTTNTVDARGNLVTVVENDGSSTYTTSYDYDLSDRLTEVTHPDGSTTTDISYDLLGRKKQLDDPDMGTWTYDYYDSGNLRTQTDAKSNELIFTYDAVGRPLTKKDDAGTLLASWSYDQARAGFLDEAVAYQGSYTVTTHNESYSDRGELLEQRVTVDDGTTAYDYDLDWTYYKSGGVKTLKYPSQGTRETVTYTYDARTQRPATLTTSAFTAPIVAAASWTTQGAPDAQTWGDATSS